MIIFLFLPILLISNFAYADDSYTTNIRIYDNDGTYYRYEMRFFTEDEMLGSYYVSQCTDATCKNKNLVTWGDYNAISYNKDGSVKSEHFYNNNRVTYIYDENNNLVERRSCYTCETDRRFQYTDTGKILVYDNNGNLMSTFNDSIDLQMNNNNYTGNLSLVSSDGNFYDKDNQGRTIGVYGQNGDVTKYKYDAGGNIISTYKNGQQTYAKTIYTPAEAAAATHDGNNNVVSITW